MKILKINDLKEIERARYISYYNTIVLTILMGIGIVLTLLYNIRYLSVVILFSILIIMEYINLRYWDTKQYMIEMMKDKN